MEVAAEKDLSGIDLAALLQRVTGQGDLDARDGAAGSDG